jgi:hypothetical protein
MYRTTRTLIGMRPGEDELVAISDYGDPAKVVVFWADDGHRGAGGHGRANGLGGPRILALLHVLLIGAALTSVLGLVFLRRTRPSPVRSP